MAEKVVLGLSGGVDSAVAAARLRDMGYAVHGLFLEVGLGGEGAARHTAGGLGIPPYNAHARGARGAPLGSPPPPSRPRMRHAACPAPLSSAPPTLENF